MIRDVNKPHQSRFPRSYEVPDNWDNLQALTIEMPLGERVYAEAGALNHTSGNIKIDVKARGEFMVERVRSKYPFMWLGTFIGHDLKPD